ncbi:MAG: threonylcarbamoyl-AMP synthase [Chloroflexi bacterium]|nr:threonylcarbamoyl-AMP synthase [Chloroflexota bacterium]
MKAVRVLGWGGLVIFPTDTVYGLGGHAFIDEAIKRIYQAKGRSFGKPLQLILAQVEDIGLVAYPVPEIAWELALRFLPGPLTLVLPAAPTLSTLALAGGNTVAVRVPNHELALALVKGLGAPLAATSANRSGRPSPISASQAVAELGQWADAVLDGGPCPVAADSTVVEVSQGRPRILRRGALPPSAIAQALGIRDEEMLK